MSSLEVKKQIDNIIKKYYLDDVILDWVGQRYFEEIFSVYLDKKYRSAIMWTKFRLAYDENYGEIYTEGYNKNKIILHDKKLLNLLKQFFIDNKTKRFIIIPIVLHRHHNIIIYDVKNNEIELFDSFGSTYGIQDTGLSSKQSKNVDIFKLEYGMYINKIKELFNKILPRKFKKFYKPADFFPKNKEFQDSEINFCPKNNFAIKAEGFCVVWSLLYAEFRIMNPDIDRKRLLKIMMENFKIITNNAINKSNSDNIKICKFIRSYALFLVRLTKNKEIISKVLEILNTKY